MFDTLLSSLTYIYLIPICYFIYYMRKLKRAQSFCNQSLNIDKVYSFIKANGGNHVSHLIFLQDKQLFWSENQKVLIAYKRIFKKMVVLGDPIGEETHIQQAIKEFCQYSEGKGLKTIFYQTSPRYMHYYHEAGFRFMKLGEEGRVNLENFSLAGKQGAKLRTRFNKFTRNSYTFRVLKPPYSKELLSDLKTISDCWLGDQKEKGFSVVSFNEEYISRFPIALLIDPEDSPVAFATLASDYKQSISIDLMRKSTESPHGTMDVLFIHIFHWAKENGYLMCSLGMSPLSRVGNDKYSFISEKIMRLAYLYGNSFYNFKGLRAFKSKFACTWEPKYLAYKKTFLPIIFIQLLILINTPLQPKEMGLNKIKYLFKKAG